MKRNIHVIDIAWIRHLLDVDSSLLFSSCYCSDDALLYNILKVRETAPNVPHVLKWVSSGARVPVTAAIGGKKKIDWQNIGLPIIFHRMLAEMKMTKNRHTHP